MNTLSFAMSAGVLALVHTKAPPAPDEWKAYLDAVIAIRRKEAVLTLLVITEGGAPNAAQRAQLAKAYGNTATRVAVCNASAIVRQVITAVGWISRGQIRGFDYDDLAGATTYLDVGAAALPEITALVQRLQREIQARPVRA